MKDFTIVIPTYNRKNRLIKVLESIYCQELSKDIYITILDNHSNYNVQEALIESFSNETLKNTNIVSYAVNIGGSLNICMPFFYCKTKWMWTMSDDDEADTDSLQTILSDIEANPTVGIIKYSFKGYINHQYEDCYYSSLEELVGFGSKKKETNLMLVSNSIYNLEVLEPFRGNIIKYAYNNIGAYNPICMMLDEKAGVLLTREKYILTYKKGDEGTGWNSFSLFMECPTFFDYEFKSSGKVLKELWGHGPVGIYSLMEELEKRELHKDWIKCQICIDKFYPFVLKASFVRKMAYIAILYTYKYTGKNILPLIYKLVGKRRKTFVG